MRLGVAAAASAPALERAKAAETETEGLRAALIAAAAALKEARSKETTKEYTTRMELESARAGAYTRSNFRST